MKVFFSIDTFVFAMLALAQILRKMHWSLLEELSSSNNLVGHLQEIIEEDLEDLVFLVGSLYFSKKHNTEKHGNMCENVCVGKTKNNRQG